MKKILILFLMPIFSLAQFNPIFYSTGLGAKNPGNTSLVAYYTLDNVNTDASSTSPSITLQNSLGYGAAKINNGFVFNATDKRGDISQTGDFLSFTNGTSDLPFSFSFWVYFTGFSSNGNRLFTKRDLTAGAVSEYHIVANSTSMNFLKGSGGSFTNSKSTAAPITWSLNTWYHICVTSDGTNEFIYVNGILKSNPTVTNGTYVAMSIIPYPLQIGDAVSQVNGEHQGLIDEIAVYKNRKLISSEVYYLYHYKSGIQYPF